jgi:hypothetical protein
MAPFFEDEPEKSSSRFELEEYKQVLMERQFVMTRYMQAIGLYVTLSGFALKELADANSLNRVWVLGSLFTVLNIMALFVAREFRNMADRAMRREAYFVDRYHVQQMYTLFWGYYAGVVLVCVSEAATIAVTTLKALSWSV